MPLHFQRDHSRSSRGGRTASEPQAAQRGMGGKVGSMEWQYKIEMIHLYSSGSDTIVKRLNELGSDGWEVVAPLIKGGDTVGVLM
jgi:hypothetical protein